MESNRCTHVILVLALILVNSLNAIGIAKMSTIISIEPLIRPDSSLFWENNRKGDIILYSADSIDFYAIRFFLSYASPFFDEMLSIPPPVNARRRRDR